MSCGFGRNPPVQPSRRTSNIATWERTVRSGIDESSAGVREMIPLDGEGNGGGGGSTGTVTGSTANAAAAASGSRLWLGLRDPRIVRVSRALEGKDRHSKVSTVKGLRDRRVRLSVPTAIQLYDLQDRLGLSQPSKVVDWLLAAAQDEINNLPPLPIPASGLTHGATAGCAMGIHTHPPATALFIANSGGGDMGYADGALGHLADGGFTFDGREPGSNSRVFLPHGGEAAAPLSLLPGGMGQFLFCSPGAMAAVPVYGPSAAAYAAATVAQADSVPDNAFAGDFSSLLKSSFSGKSQNK